MMQRLILSSVLGGCLAIRGNCLTADSTAGTAAELSAASHSGERPMRALQPQELLSAMYKTLDTREAKIEIVEFSHFPAPEGALEFAWKDLAPPASARTPTRWRGYVRHDGNRRFAVWAMVRVTAQCRRVVAAKALRVRNPHSRKIFLARVNDEGIAVVEDGQRAAYASSPGRKQP